MRLRIAGILLLSTCLFAGCNMGKNTGLSSAGNSAETGSAIEESSSSSQDTDSDAVASRDVFAMDTYMTVTAYGNKAEKAVEAAEAEIHRLDDLLSTGNESSEIAQLNKNKKATVSDDTITLLEKALELNRETEGAFNPAVYPIMEEWGFASGNYKIPDAGTLEELLKYMDLNTISVTDHEVRLNVPQMEIDFGGIAKGYTSDRIMEIYKQNGISSGIVSLGGNVQTLGLKPDGSEWRVAVQNPNAENSEDFIGILQVHDKAVITSGGYERYFEEGGVRYHHIIDPSKGYPADSGIISSTIVSSDGMLADGLSTSLFVMGLDKAKDYWRSHRDQFDAILVTEDGAVYVTEGIADHFTSSLKIKVIKE